MSIPSTRAQTDLWLGVAPIDQMQVAVLVDQDSESLMGKTSIGLMPLSNQYWAPHGKLAPFLKGMTAQIDGCAGRS